jgi:hypothetical protein
MNRKGAWIVVGLTALLAVGSGLFAQIVFHPEGGPGGGGVRVNGLVPGRFQAVSSSPDGVVILDSATGDLYRAGPGDIKPYHARPQIHAPGPQPPFEFRKDKFEDEKKPAPFEFKDEKKPGPNDRFKDKDEPRFKDERKDFKTPASDEKKPDK